MKQFTLKKVGIVAVLCLGLLGSTQVYAQYPSAADSLALVDLYNDTGGPTWTTSTNWLVTDQPVSTWYGVYVNGSGEIWKVKLKNNNLTGTLPASLFTNLTDLTFFQVSLNNLTGGIDGVENCTSLVFLAVNGNQFSDPLPDLSPLTSLVELYLQNNQFTGADAAGLGSLVSLKYLYLLGNQFDAMPDLSTLTQLIDLRVENNLLEFDDLEDLMVTPSVFKYSPQAKLGSADTFNKLTGQSITITIPAGGTGNTYEWYKTGNGTAVATTASLTINPIALSDDGTYTMYVENAAFPLLTLESELQTLSVSDPGVPLVTTTAISAITSSTATSGGNVTSDGGAPPVTARGVCWNTAGTPTTGDFTTSDGTGTGTYASSLTGLTAGTTYYVRAYAVNSNGTGYGDEVEFTTLPDLPTVTTSAVTGITMTSATGNGEVTNNGGGTISASGVCWNTGGTPTLADDFTTDGTASGAFTSTMTGLTAGTTYYVRAYATNEAGTSYGNEVSYTTLFDVDNMFPEWYISTDGDLADPQTNKIVIQAGWDTGLKTVKVYVETTSIDNWVLVGSIDMNGAGPYELIDASSDPNTMPYSYKLKLVDDNDDESTVYSDMQRSIHLLVNDWSGSGATGGPWPNLAWTSYVGLDVDSYEVYGVDENGPPDTHTLITTIPGNLNTYSDFLAGYDYYYVEAVFAVPVPGMKSGGVMSSRSNIISIKPLNQEVKMLIYPNPVADQATIQLTNPGNNPYRLSVIDMTGKVWMEQSNVISGDITLPCSELPTGIYFVELIGDSVLRSKIMVR